MIALDVRGVEPALGRRDVHARGGVHADALADLAQGLQLLADVGAAVGPIAPEDGGDAAMRQQEGIRSAHLVVVAELATHDGQVASVVVLDEGHAPDRVASHDARELSPTIQAAEVVGVDAILERVVHRKVVHCHEALGGSDVIPQDLDIPVPILGHRVGRARGADVLLLEPGAVAENEVQAQGAEPDIFHEPLDEGLGVLLDLLVGVVDVRRVLDVHASGIGTLAVPRAVVPADGPALPVRILEHGPLALIVLLLPTSVVDHNVGDGGDASPVHLFDDCPQLGLRAVLGVQVVPLARQVSPVVDGLGGRRHPDHVDACFLHVGYRRQEGLVPTILVVATLPIEGLQQDVGLRVAHARHPQHVHSLARDALAARALVLAVLHREEGVRGLPADLLHQHSLRGAARHGAVRQMNSGDLVDVGLARPHVGVLPLEAVEVLPRRHVPADDRADAICCGLILGGQRPVDVVGRHGGAAEVHGRLPGELNGLLRGAGHLQPHRGPRLARHVRLHQHVQALVGLGALHIDR
mmetsp:Transcript_78399/g.199309  ORF Transcript_78399/g.199309 Transcript_78399/m.199309 type:complete len:525 (-) Transcript_78399:644-2218(-)